MSNDKTKTTMKNKEKENNDVELYKDEYEFRSNYNRKIILDTIKDWKMTELFESGERNLPYYHSSVFFLNKDNKNFLNRHEPHEGIPDEIILSIVRKWSVEKDILHDEKFDGCLGWTDGSLINMIHSLLNLEDDGMIGRGTGMRVQLGMIRDYLIDEGIIKGKKDFKLYK